MSPSPVKPHDTQLADLDRIAKALRAAETTHTALRDSVAAGLEHALADPKLHRREASKLINASNNVLTMITKGQR